MNDAFVLNIAEDWKVNTGQALYRALYDHFRKLILSGDLKSGTQLPASRNLAEILDLSRNTVIEGYSLLQADGFIYSKTGAGYYVSDNLAEENLFTTGSIDHNVDVTAPQISERAKNWLRLHDQSRHTQNAQAFAPGRTALEDFPFDVWARLLSRRWRLSGTRLGMIEDPAGYLPLRTQLADHLKSSRGVNCDADQILIVSGAQQGLDLIGRVLWEAGDDIVVDDPGFAGINGVVEGAGANLHPISIDEEGMDVETADTVHKDVKTFLVTPSRNYPLGVTMSLARRLSLLKVARDKSAWVVEDDYDSDFRFEGRPLSSLQGLDQDGRVIYVGSFSRILFPALRLGFVVLPKTLVPAFLAAKSYIDGHTSIIHQAALADFFEEGYYASHLRRMRKLYKVRRQYMLDILENDFRDELRVLPSDGGLHICVAFKQPRDDIKFASKLEAEGIIVRPLSRFYRNGNKQSGFLMGFAGYSENEVRLGLGKLREILSS